MKSQDVLLLLKLFSLHYYDNLILDNNKLSLKTLFDNELEENQFLFAARYRAQLKNYLMRDLNMQNNHHKLFMDMFSEQEFIELFADNRYSLLALEKSTGISKSQISLAIKRCVALKLLFIKDGIPYVNVHDLFNIIRYAIMFFFPIKKVGLQYGLPISASSLFLNKKILVNKEYPMVWAYTKGNVWGEAIEPIYPTAPAAALKDPILYELLVLVDAIRANNPREKMVAINELERILLKR